jgi:hypothetical protein
MKVDILATRLLQLQDAGETMSSSEQALATTMIENSDNDAATDLFGDDGKVSGVTAANKTFGLTDTTVNTHWGDTQTTSADQLKILQAVFTSDSPLTAANREYIQDLMSNVESDQQWGVSAAADSGTTYMLKNGWLEHPTLWEINSIGEIKHGDHTYLVTVLSIKQDSEEDGIDHIESIAKAAVDAVASDDL